ncbi:MAG: hypothetical protein ACFE0Q_00865 [Anaerolineae bacterium]
MTRTNQTNAMQQASTIWKATAYLLLMIVVGFGLYGAGRFFVATFILANFTQTSLYQLICLPATVLGTPIAIFALPLVLIRDMTHMQARYAVIASVLMILGVIGVIVFLPLWAEVLWGIRL